MIEFSCSCGKKYRLPDRNAEREVRCNQCEKTLIVPKHSQVEPVVPLSDRLELIIEPEGAPSVAERKVESVVEKKVEKKPTPTEKEVPKVSVPEKKIEPENEKKVETAPKSVPVSSTVEEETPPNSFDDNVPLPSPPSTSLFDDRKGGMISYGVLTLLLILLTGVTVLGVVAGRLSASLTLPSFEKSPFERQAEEIERQLSEQTHEETTSDESLKQYAEAADAAARESDAAKRTDSMKQAEILYRSLLAEYDAGQRKKRQSRFLTGLADEFHRLSNPKEQEHPINVDFSLFDTPTSVAETVDDWKIDKEKFFDFDVRTSNDDPILLSLDGDPTTAKSGKKANLDELAVVLDDDKSIQGSESHTVSLRIDSASGEELSIVWPRHRQAGLDEAGIKELKFCIYFSGAANKVNKPGKPAGLDKTLELADFRIRLGDAFGTTDFVLKEKERIAVCEKGRIAWYVLTVPMNGDDVWQRTEHGRMNPKTVDFIEFRAKPTGAGITFWIDNLKIVSK